MNRYFFKETEYGITAAALLPSRNKILQLFVGHDGSTSIQVHPYSHGKNYVEQGLDSFKLVDREKIYDLFTNEMKVIWISFVESNGAEILDK